MHGRCAGAWSSCEAGAREGASPSDVAYRPELALEGDLVDERRLGHDVDLIGQVFLSRRLLPADEQ